LQSDSEVQMGIMVLPADSGILQDSLEVPWDSRLRWLFWLVL
jgi:hypothetical protein